MSNLRFSVACLVMVGCEPAVLELDTPDAAPEIVDVAQVMVDPTCNASDADPLIALRCYTCAHACDADLPSYCAQDGWPRPHASCLAKGRDATGLTSTVYRWYEQGADDIVAHEQYLRPFVLLPYMRKLRNAAADPDIARILDDQLVYVLGHTKTYVADVNGPRSTVFQSYYVRPSDGAVRVHADGLNQAGYAFYFLSLAKNVLDNKELRDRYIELAIQFDNAMERPNGNKTGGVLRTSATACGGANLTGPCTYFHSRAPENGWMSGTALNQSLFVLRSATDLLAELDDVTWAGNWPSDPVYSRDAWRNRLRDRIAAGIDQWAYGVGNSAMSPDEPPRLNQHMRRKGTAAPYYWADYEFDMTAHQSVEVGTHDHMCNYHTVTVNNLGIILRSVDANDGTGAPGAIYDALDSRYPRVSQARAALMTYTTGGVIEAVGATSAHPVYQWFVSEVTPSLRASQEQCPVAGEDGTEELYPEVKTYFCTRFGGAANPALIAPCAP